MSDLKSFVENRLADLDRNPFEAAREGGLERSFVNDILIGKKRTVSGGNVNKLAQALDATASDIISAMGTGSPRRSVEQTAPPSEVGPRTPLTEQPQRGGRPDLAVRGIALGGKEGDGDFELNGDALQFIERPAGLIGRKNAFAVIIRNSSMEPVYRHGWPIFVDPDGRKPVDGEDVLIELWGDDEHEPGPAFIKTLVGRRGGQVVLSQYNPPPPELHFPADRVKQVLRVIPYVEAMGLAV